LENPEVQRRAIWEGLKIEPVVFMKPKFAMGWPMVITYGHLSGRFSVKLVLPKLSVAKNAEERRHG
jgi:hypothetical protein